MADLIKISIFILLVSLSAIMMMLFQEQHSMVFAAAGLACVAAFVITATSHFAEDIFNFLAIFKRKFYKHTISNPMQNNFVSGDIWTKFIDDNIIPGIIFNNNLDIKAKNKTFAELLLKYGLDEHAEKLSDIFSCDLKNFIGTVDKGGADHLTGDATLKNSNNSPFVFFSFQIGENNGSKLYLAQFVDNSEKTELKEKFIQAQKMQAIGQLAGGVAHDFNNLLTAIIGFCDLLLTKHLPGDPSFLDIMQIKQNANRAANLVRQLLAFSRKQTMQMDVLQLNEVLAEIANLIRRLIGENIKLNINFDRDLWDVKADKSQLDQVLINLAVNARDAMENVRSGGAELNINCENIEIVSPRDVKFKYTNGSGTDDITPGKYLKISVSDNGSGISPQNIKKIFEPFFTTKEIGHGTGLGLATVTGIVQQTGGFIYVSSQQGEGTEFLIFIKKHEKSASDVKQIEEKKEKAKDLTGTGNILIVEDEDAVRMFSARALKNKGYNILEAFNGENGLEVVEKFGGDKIDLIISDVVMPGISGPEFVEEVIKKHPTIKVVFVSGYGEDAFYQKYGLERKFNFLAKPYSLNQLAEKVKEILG